VIVKLFSSIHPIIHPWHHTGKKTLAEINNPRPYAHVLLSRKGMPGPGLRSFYCGQLYVAISQVTSSANIKIFSSQGPDGYMRNVVCREVLEM
jgi:hypothetical protein